MASKYESGSSGGGGGGGRSGGGSSGRASKAGGGSSRGALTSRSGSKGGGAAPAAAKPISNYAIHKSYGGTQAFMHSFDLKMWNSEDVEEMHRITDAFKAADMEAQNAADGRGARSSGRGGKR